MVAPAEPGAFVGRGEQRRDLGDGVALVAFGRDRHQPGDRVRVLGMFERREPVEGVDRSEAGVAGSRAVTPVVFEVLEEEPISGASRSSMSNSKGCLPVCSRAKRNSSLNASR
jgi:hypothetical protein